MGLLVTGHGQLVGTGLECPKGAHASEWSGSLVALLPGMLFSMLSGVIIYRVLGELLIEPTSRNGCLCSCSIGPFYVKLHRTFPGAKLVEVIVYNSWVAFAAVRGSSNGSLAPAARMIR